VGDLLVLWDVDGTLLNAGGVGGDLYETVFAQLFGCSLGAFAPMAGRTDRAIILETLELAGISEPRRYVDPFIRGLSAHAPSVREAVAVRGRALPGAAAALAALAAARIPDPQPVPDARVPAARVPTGAVSQGGPFVPALGGPGGLSGHNGHNGLGPPRPGSGGLGEPGVLGRVRQAVLTGNVRPLAEVKLAALGLRNGLDLCIGAYGDDHEERTELVHVARRRAAAVHGRLPGDFDGTATVVVGDTPLDVEAALEAGARAVGVATGRYAAADLVAAGADAVLPDLTDTRLVMDTLLP
jgi:phosphoglycolate phosphatase-like HAD superfamily hydrolase